MQYMPQVKSIFLAPQTSGFVQLELINYLAALINARNARIDDMLLNLDMMSCLLDLFFNTSRASLIHSHITEFILVPVCEDQVSTA